MNRLSGHCRSHLAAGFGTATARLSAAAAVLVVVLFALGSTASARLGTHTAQLSMKIRISRHEASADVARIRTVATQLNALRHHLHHVAVQAGGLTVFAIAQTIETVLDAGF